VQDDAGAARSAPVSAVMSTRVKPGKEAEYRAWERKIAAAQSKAPGLQGYRFEPAIPGVQEDCVAILRFDNEANLNAWLESPERKRLVEEAAPLTEEFHSRMVRSGFETWFRDVVPATGGGQALVWKMNALVLLMLYPIVFLWSVWVGFPLLNDRLHLAFAIALFIGNIVSVALTGYLVPWVANRFGWWLNPAGANALRTNLLGAGIILVLYAVMVIVFWRLF
jgi:antibiotic biosynthesis monooxygenase (ABM) superfamily enzyme